MAKRTKLPLTVKTRLGWDEKTIKIVEVAERLQDVGIKAILELMVPFFSLRNSIKRW